MKSSSIDATLEPCCYPLAEQLFDAIALGSELWAVALIGRGADLQQTDAGGRTPLHLAIADGQHQVIRALVCAGADVNVKDDEGLTPLHVCAQRLDLGSAFLLLAEGAHINACDDLGNSVLTTVLFRAQRAEAIQMARFLLGRGASMELSNHAGFTTLDVMSRVGVPEARLALCLDDGLRRPALNRPH